MGTILARRGKERLRAGPVGLGGLPTERRCAALAARSAVARCCASHLDADELCDGDTGPVSSGAILPAARSVQGDCAPHPDVSLLGRRAHADAVHPRRIDLLHGGHACLRPPPDRRRRVAWARDDEAAGRGASISVERVHAPMVCRPHVACRDRRTDRRLLPPHRRVPIMGGRQIRRDSCGESHRGGDSGRHQRVSTADLSARHRGIGGRRDCRIDRTRADRGHLR